MTIEIQQDADAVAQPHTEPGAIGELEIRRAAADERMTAAEVVTQGHAPHPFGEIGGAVARADQITNDGLERTRTRPHQCDLRACPLEDARADRVPLGGVAVEQIIRGFAAKGRSQFPAEIHRITQSEVQALPAQRRMDVRGIARQQYAAVAVSRGLLAAVRPRRGDVQDIDVHVLAGHAAQHRLHVLAREWRAMRGAAVEVGEPDRARCPLRVIASRRGMTPERQHGRIGKIDLHRIAGELRLGADEIEIAEPAHRAATAVAPHEPTGTKHLAAGLHGDFIVRNLKPFDAETAFDFDTQRECMLGKHTFEMRHFDAELDVRRARQTMRPARRIDVGVVELDAGEIAGRAAALRCRRHRARPRLVVAARLRSDWFQQSTPVERLDARPPQPTHAERKLLQRRLRVIGLSSTNTEIPARRNSQARNKPTGPAPAMTTS